MARGLESRGERAENDREAGGAGGVCTVNEHDMAAHAIGSLDVGSDLDGVQVKSQCSGFA
jgi:hypothetical protein